MEYQARDRPVLQPNPGAQKSLKMHYGQHCHQQNATWNRCSLEIFHLPLSSDRTAAVTLKRAKRLMPQATKKSKIATSIAPRNPTANPRAAGASPNEIVSASESRSAPSADDLCRHRATRPSAKSKNQRQWQQYHGRDKSLILIGDQIVHQRQY